MSEKKRSQNFTEKEIQILLKICNRYKTVIECKKTDALTNKDKEEAWKKVTKDFHNLTMDSSRSVKQLQEKYKAVKKKIKSDCAKNVQYARGTGGGPYKPPPAPKTDEEKELMETIKLSVEGLNNPFDNDGMSGGQGIDPEEVVQNDEESDNDHMIDADWTSGSASLWQTPKHPSLKSTGTPSLPRPVFEEAENTTNPKEKENTGENTNMVESDETNINNKNITNMEKRNWQSRRRPVLKKKKTVSSAGAKFEIAAEKKMELIEYQKLVAETQLQQNNQEHQMQMEILEIQKHKETLKCDILQQGKLVFEF